MTTLRTVTIQYQDHNKSEVFDGRVFKRDRPRTPAPPRVKDAVPYLVISILLSLTFGWTGIEVLFFSVGAAMMPILSWAWDLQEHNARISRSLDDA